MRFTFSKFVLTIGLGLLAIFSSSCLAELGFGEMTAITGEMMELGVAESFAISGEAILIVDESILAQTLDRVFLEGEELYIKTAEGSKLNIGTVTGRRTAIINHFGERTFPGDIYVVKGGRVNVRTSAIITDEYNVFQHRETGQVVLRILEKDGWAYVQIGNHEFGWMSLQYLSVVNDKTSVTAPKVVYHQCSVCKGTGHGIQNVKCSICNGKGHIICPDCKGAKQAKCIQCHGTGSLFCYHCSGKGSIKCERCFGKGYSDDGMGKRTFCTYCDGVGNKNCTDCDGQGKKICGDCDGKCEKLCATCLGTGNINCYDCNKTGNFRQDLLCKECLGTGWIQTKSN